MRQFAFRHESWNNAVGSPACRQHGVGHNTHQADVATAPDEFNPFAGQQTAKIRRRIGIGRILPCSSAAKYAD